MKFIQFLIIIAILIFGCERSDTNTEQNRPDSMIIVDSLKTPIENAQLENAPDWFKDLPEVDGKIVVRGYGKSRRADLAEEKAFMDAQNKLAESMLTDKSEPIAGHEVQQIVPYQVLQKKRTQVGDQWHVYLLLEKSKDD